MDLNQITIQPADPTRHFTAIAALLTTQETEPSTAESLQEWFNKQPAGGIRFSVALSPLGHLLGLTGSTAHSPTLRETTTYIILSMKNSAGKGWVAGYMTIYSSKQLN